MAHWIAPGEMPMRRLRLLICLWLVGLVACGTPEPTVISHSRAEQISTATQVARDGEATQTARLATQTAQAIPTSTLTPTVPPTPTNTRTPTVRPAATATRMATATLPRPTRAAPAGDPTASGEKVLVEDDLTVPGHGWYGGDKACIPGSTTQEVCQDEQGLHMLIAKSSKWAELMHTSLPDLGDVSVDLSIRLGDDTAGIGGYGILCRYQPNGNGYVLTVWSDGYYSVYRMIDGKEYIVAEAVRPSRALLPGSATNQLHLECIGDTFVIAVNGQELLRATDPAASLEPGQVELYGCTCRGAPLDAIFTYVRVATPEDPQQRISPRSVPTQKPLARPDGFVLPAVR
jgi:hypothetical protein